MLAIASVRLWFSSMITMTLCSPAGDAAVVLRLVVGVEVVRVEVVGLGLVGVEVVGLGLVGLGLVGLGLVGLGLVGVEVVGVEVVGLGLGGQVLCFPRQVLPLPCAAPVGVDDAPIVETP